MLTDSIELNQKYNEHTAVALIGRGRSTVLEARSPSGEKRVIKIFDQRVPGKLFTDVQRAAIRTMSSGQIGALVRVFGMGCEERGFMFLLMDHVVGKGIYDRVLSEDAAVQAVVEFCRELEKLAPSDPLLRYFERSDLMLSSTGRLILIDHPVLRMSDPRALSERLHHYPDAQDVSLASPEAIQGRSTTPAAFVYTLACLTVHLCTGDGPFRGRDEIATAIKHLSSEPDLRIKNDRLRQLMLFCLEKDPVYRRSSIREFRQELETVFD